MQKKIFFLLSILILFIVAVFFIVITINKNKSYNDNGSDKQDVDAENTKKETINNKVGDKNFIYDDKGNVVNKNKEELSQHINLLNKSFRFTHTSKTNYGDCEFNLKGEGVLLRDGKYSKKEFIVNDSDCEKNNIKNSYIETFWFPDGSSKVVYTRKSANDEFNFYDKNTKESISVAQNPELYISSTVPISEGVKEINKSQNEDNVKYSLTVDNKDAEGKVDVFISNNKITKIIYDLKYWGPGLDVNLEYHQVGEFVFNENLGKIEKPF